MSVSMTLKPRMSEKAYAMSQTSNVYVFEVPVDATKLTVTEAVKAQFDVSVTDVNIMNVIGKVKRTVRRGGRATSGRRPRIKKAYVTLAEGDSIAIFANEEDTSESKTAKKKEKK